MEGRVRNPLCIQIRILEELIEENGIALLEEISRIEDRYESSALGRTNKIKYITMKI